MLNRKLGGFEATWAQMDDFVPVLFVGVLHLENGPAPEALRAALAALQIRHPLMRVCLERNKTDYAFREASHPPPVPLRLLPRNDPDHWRGVTEEELNTAMDTSVPPLLRCTYLHGDPASDLVLTIHHTIIDSRAGLSFIDQLLRLCADAGDTTIPASRAPLLPLHALYPPDYRGWRGISRTAGFMVRQMVEELRYRIQLKGRQPLHADTPTRCRILDTRLDRDATAALAKAARKRGIPLNSLLHAAMLVALAKRRYGGQSMPMRGLTFADMRPYLAPQPEDEDLGVYISMLHYSVPVTPETDILALAETVRDRIYRSTKQDDKFIAPLISRHLVRMLVKRKSMRLGMIALSYIGPLDLAETYGSISLSGLSGFISNNVLGPELAGFGNLLHGSLNLDFLYLDSDMDAAEAGEIVDDIQSCLLGVIKQYQEASP